MSCIIFPENSRLGDRFKPEVVTPIPRDFLIQKGQDSVGNVRYYRELDNGKTEVTHYQLTQLRKKEGKIDVGDTVQFVIHNEYIKEWAYSQDRVSGELVWIPVDRELKVKDKGLYEIVSMTDLLFVQGFVELWGKIILKPINPKLDTSESAKTATSL